jgi:type I restriction enzyme, S subunit
MSTTKTSAQVPKLRFPGFEGEWPRQQLDAITSKKISYGIVQAGEHVPGGMPYIKSQNLNHPLDLDSLQRTSEEIARKYRRSEVEPGDIVFSLRGNIGVCQIVPASIPEANLTQGTARIAVAEHDNRLVAQTLQTLDIVRQIEACAKGSTFREISLEALRKITVALAPTVPEQQKIAAFLTAVDGRIEQLSRKKALLEEYKKGVMQQLFTQTLRFQDDHGHDFPDWEEKMLGNVVDLLSGQHLGPEDYNEDGQGVPYFTGPSDFTSDPSSFTKWTPQNTKIAKPDSVLITVKGNGVGRVMYSTLDQVALGRQLMALRSSSCDNRYLYQYLLTKAQEFIALGSGNLIPGLSRGDILTMALPCPSLPEQTKIAGFLSALDGKIGAVGELMRQTQAWKKGLLQQMFV